MLRIVCVIGDVLAVLCGMCCGRLMCFRSSICLIVSLFCSICRILFSVLVCVVLCAFVWFDLNFANCCLSLGLYAIIRSSCVVLSMDCVVFVHFMQYGWGWIACPAGI